MERVVAAAARTAPVLTRLPEADHGDGSTIALVEGENYDALRALTAIYAQPEGPRVDVIYIDPPYNTGRRDFLYNDHHVDPRDEYSSTTWLTFMDRRLALAARMLAPDGFIAVSIDDHEYAHLCLLMENHFGPRSIKTVVVRMSEPAGVKMTHASTGTLPKLKEYVVFAGMGRPPRLFVPPVPKAQWDPGYRRVLAGFTRRHYEAFVALGPAPSARALARFERSLAPVALVAQRDVLQSEGVDPRDATALAAWRAENAWRIARTTNGSGSLRAVIRARASVPEQSVIAVRTPSGPPYLATPAGDTILLAVDHLTTHVGDLWTDIKTTNLATEGAVTFRNGKKPLALVQRIVGAHPNPHALVLDFFAGSGTTGEAVAALNAADGGTRRAVLITNNEGGICRDQTYPRLLHVIDGYPGHPPRAVALRYLRLTGSAPYGDPALRETQLSLLSLRDDVWDREDRSGYTLLSSGSTSLAVSLTDDPAVARAALADAATQYRRADIRLVTPVTRSLRTRRPVETPPVILPPDQTD